MQFDVWSKGLATLEADCLVIGVFEDGELAEEAKTLDTAAGGRLDKIVARGDFPGKTGETLLIGDLEGQQDDEQDGRHREPAQEQLFQDVSI